MECKKCEMCANLRTQQGWTILIYLLLFWEITKIPYCMYMIHAYMLSAYVCNICAYTRVDTHVCIFIHILNAHMLSKTGITQWRWEWPQWKDDVHICVTLIFLYDCWNKKIYLTGFSIYSYSMIWHKCEGKGIYIAVISLYIIWSGKLWTLSRLRKVRYAYGNHS